MTKRRGIFQWVIAIGLALLIAFFIRTFLVGNFIVSGISMNPTLQNGDRLIVNKLAYPIGKPAYGDIIIFKHSAHEDYVKRIIGLPGDTLYSKNDQLYRNGKKVSEPYLTTEKRQLKSGVLTDDFTLKEVTGRTRVPKGELFVMGDNRRRSYDSRRIGCIKRNKVIGKVALRYYPLRSFKWIN